MNEYPTIRRFNQENGIVINNTNFTIGRSLSCNHIIESILISRLHCTIKKTDGMWQLFDNSTNGTRVNSNLYKANQFVTLKNGDIISFAEGTDDLVYIFNTPGGSSQESTVILEPATTNELDNLQQNLEEQSDQQITNENAAVAPVPVSNETNQKEPNENKVVEQNLNVEAPTTTENAKRDFDIMESELTCSICSELFIKAMTLSCSHTFCNACISQWRKTKQTCPICRKLITAISPTLVLDNFINRKLETCSEEMKETRKEIIAQREATCTASTSKESEPSSTTNQSVIEIYSDEDLEEEESYSDYSYSFNYSYDDDDYDEEDDDDYEDNDTPYNGVPGVYYGGWGRCYICKQRGHWANGCPNKR